MKNTSNRQNIKMSDIAEAAGVSLATVGRVLHNNGYVSKENRQKIEQLIEEMGYVPNQMARGLKNQRSRLIGHMVVLNPNMLFAKISLAVNQAAMEHGFHAITMSSHYQLSEEETQIDELIGYQVDGVVITSNVMIDKGLVKKLTDQHIPVVMVERTYDLPNVDCIKVNDLQGARQAVNHILEKGHTRIGFVGMKPFHEVEAQRYQGYGDALTEAGLTVDEQLVCLQNNYSLESGTEAIEQLMKLENPPSAIFATSDLYLGGILQVLYAMGSKVPEDLSLVGYDDTHSAMMSPPITSIGLALADIGEQVMTLLENRMENPQSPEKICMINTELVDRRSVKNVM